MSVRKNSFIRCVTIAAILIVFVQCVGCFGLFSNNKRNEFIPSKPAKFAFGIQQEGKNVSVSNHEVTLNKKPFEMVFYFKESPAMLVQASLRPNAVQMAKAGVRMDKILDMSSQISENFQNPSKLMYVYSDNFQRYHNWPYLDKDSHRYDQSGIAKVPLNKGGGYLCTRTVSGISIDGREEKIQDYPSNTLYLVFFTVTRDKKNQFVEAKRDWMIVRFK